MSFCNSVIPKWRSPGFSWEMFKDSFKYYKSRDPPPDLKNVIDFSKPDFSKVRFLLPDVVEEENLKLGLKPTKEWKIYEIVDKPGLIFIENPFTNEGQRYWISKSVKEYSRRPNKLNLDPHGLLDDHENWWDVCSTNHERARILLPKLRWATLGYHHNWDTKRYTEDSKNKIPWEMAAVTEFLARITGHNDFKAEAAIVNYYRMNSTLAGHTDHSEINVEAPLLSLSFGQTGIFLIGGLSQEDPAEAVFLRSGDIVIMTKGSRLRYHGVPRILSADSSPWEIENIHGERESGVTCADWDEVKRYISQARININVRQVLKPGQMTLDGYFV